MRGRWKLLWSLLLTDLDVFCGADGQVPIESIVHFGATGFATLRGLLTNELRDSKLLAAIDDASISAEIAYYHGARRFMERSYNLSFECAHCYEKAASNGSSWDGYFRDDLHAEKELSHDQRVARKAAAAAALKCCQNQGRHVCESRKSVPCSDGLPKLPFYQSVNLDRYQADVRKLATSATLGMAAAMLLQEPNVRLYQTALFAKTPGTETNDLTSWHRDLTLVPLDTNRYLTIWCPIRRGLKGKSRDSLLTFAKGSHLDLSGALRKLSGFEQGDRPYEEATDEVRQRFELSYIDHLRVGDCSAHHGWLLHSSLPQGNKKPRHAIAFSFVAANAVTLSGSLSSFDEDRLSWEAWFPRVGQGNTIDHPLLPIVWPRQAAGDTSREEQESHRRTSARRSDL